MITDDPDEDAENLDDEALLNAYLGRGQSGKSSDPENSAEDIPDWPPSQTRNVGLIVDANTLGWFKANHADWRREMGFVLRAWVAVQAAAASPKRSTPTDDHLTS